MATGTTQIALTGVMGVLLLLVVRWLVRVENWRSYAVSAGGSEASHQTPEHAEKPSGLVRWITTVDHKDIGLMYGVFAVLSFAWGGIAVVLMRTELTTPPVDLLSETFFDILPALKGGVLALKLP